MKDDQLPNKDELRELLRKLKKFKDLDDDKIETLIDDPEFHKEIQRELSASLIRGENYQDIPTTGITIDLRGILERLERQHWIIKYTIYSILNFIFIGSMAICLILLWNMHPLIFAIVTIMCIPMVIRTGREIYHDIHAHSLKQALPIIIVFLDVILMFLVFGIWLFYFR